MPTKVPIGPTSVAGYGVSTAAFVAAVLAFINGDHGPSTIGVIAAGTIGALAFLATQIGRYRQATAQITASAPPAITTTGQPAQLEARSFPPAIAGQLLSAGPPELEDTDEPRDELDERAKLVPTTASPPPDEGDAGDPATTAGGQA